MEQDTFYVIGGLILVLFALFMWGIYLLRRDSMLLDAVSLGWLGHIVWVGAALLGSGLFMPQRSWSDSKYGVFAIVASGTLAYAIGVNLKWGSTSIGKLLPTPKDNISVLNVWILLIVSIVIYFVSMLLVPIAPPRLYSIIFAVNASSLGAIGVFSILLMTAFRQAWISRFVGITFFLGVFAIFFLTAFSRRPLPALIGALVAVLYHLHLQHRRFIVKLMFLGFSAVGLVVLLSFLTATRGERVFGVGRSGEVLSRNTAMSILGGSMIGVNVFEFTYHQYPEMYPYLWGKGMAPVLVFWIPRAVWPGKPVPSGGVITEQYLGTDAYNVPNTIFGEVFMNFTAWGVPPFMFLAGSFVAAINKRLHEQRHNLTLWLAWFIVVPDFMSEWRGDLTSMTVQGIVRVSFFLGMTWFLGKLFPGQPRIQIGTFAESRPMPGGHRRHMAPPPPQGQLRPTYYRR